ncbi:hypothetical protein ACV357_37080, partial [Pseudomonas aeruginosa]
MIDGGNMSAAQPGILTPIPVVGRYLFFSISQPEQVAATLARLAAATDGYQLVVGIGHSLMLSLGKTRRGREHQRRADTNHQWVTIGGRGQPRQGRGHLLGWGTAEKQLATHHQSRGDNTWMSDCQDAWSIRN